MLIDSRLGTFFSTLFLSLFALLLNGFLCGFFSSSLTHLFVCLMLWDEEKRNKKLIMRENSLSLEREHYNNVNY
jgi:hypothetical protein